MNAFCLIPENIENNYGAINHVISMSTGGYNIDEAKLITGSSDKIIRFIDLNSNGRVISQIKNENPVKYLKMHESGDYLLMADTSNIVKLFDVRSCTLVSSFKDNLGSKT